MSQKLVPRPVLRLLVAGILLLPITICVILAVRALLVAMDDTTGGNVLEYVAWGCGVLWVIDLVALVVVQGLGALVGSDEPPESQ